MSRVHPDDLEAVRMLINDIQALENRAHRLRMTLAGHALNEAKNKAGWELAEQMAKKDFANSLKRAAAEMRRGASAHTATPREEG